MSEITLRRMQPKDWAEVAELIYDSTNGWYVKNRGFSIFAGEKSSTQLFCRTYEALDPGWTVIAEETATGRIAGSCFIHPRPTHVSLGIMNVHPDFFGRSIATRLLNYITDIADQEGKPVRLVSSAMNLDSFSLYNKAGFVPILFFQDMLINVPETGVSFTISEGETIRPATQEDVLEIVALEKELYHIEREKDFRYFIENHDNAWRMCVLLGPFGKIEGYLASVHDPGSHLLGPGIARTEAQAIALVCHELNYHCGTSLVCLVPSQCQEFVQAMYKIGAKNCELHVAQVRGPWKPTQGVVIPTFMPETA